MKKFIVYGFIFCLGFVVSYNYGNEIVSLSNKSLEKISSYVEEQRFIKRAEELGKKAKQSENRFKNMLKSKTSTTLDKSRSSKKQKRLKVFYAYGTDSFDPSSNAKCYVLDINKKMRKVSLSCHGNYKLQKKVQASINNKIRRGEL